MGRVWYDMYVGKGGGLETNTVTWRTTAATMEMVRL